MDELLGKLQSFTIFNGLSTHQLLTLIKTAQKKIIPAHTCFIREGDSEKSFYVIIEGEVAIFKSVNNHKQVIANLYQGECIGELALFDDEFRSASAETLTDTQLLLFQTSSFNKDSTFALEFAIILKNIGRSLAHRIRQTNQSIITALKLRLAMGVFTVRIIIVTTFYAFSLYFVEYFKKLLPNTTLISVLLLVFFSVIIFDSILKSKYPLAMYGLTMRNWRRSLIESFLFTLPIIVLFVLIKWYLITYIPSLHHYPLFDITDTFKPGNPFSLKTYFLSLIGYMIFCPAQELVVRGGIQSSLQNFLLGPVNRVKWSAILISNFLFSTAHIHVGLGLALAVFIPGIFWGWLYARQKTLLGVSISHVLLGVFTIFILGIRNIISTFF